ncbi:MAG: hypothetical protein ACRD3O_05930, partial [Terriglobia bacterium]
MKKKLWALVFGIGLVALGWYVPAKASPAFGGALQASQSATTSPRMQAMQLVLSGKILVEHGHYVFYNLDTKS